MDALWTPDQKAAIELDNRNLLIAAAAGSGKTAVLVERIIRLITEKKVDVDKLLVVTFTNAAAAEMRERIGLAIEQKLEENPNDEHLQKQMSLIHNSYIMTIDGFCKRVIQDYFHKIDLDPSFRIGDEGELKLLKAEVMEELLEEKYAQNDESFINFAESYATGKSDEVIEKMILQLYEFSTSYPWPKKWLDTCAKAYDIDSIETFENSEWVKMLLCNINATFEDLIKIEKRALGIATDNEDGPFMYEDALKSDLAQLEYIVKSDSYREYQKRISTMEFARLSTKKSDIVSEEKRELVKTLRNEVKSIIKDLKEKFFFAKVDEITSDIVNSKAAVNTLISLTKDFLEKFKEEKIKKNIVDFSDLEHFALDILCEENEEQIIATAVAKTLGENFEEIIVDEYQDSNMVQEYILTAVSKCNQGKNNIFMVGDVKQSIYKFRLARPEIFMEKYDTYSNYKEKEDICQKIELQNNFRSREQVIEAVNYIFFQIMGKDLGNVEYDKAAALYLGANFPILTENEKCAYLGVKEPENFDADAYNTELIIIDEDSIEEAVQKDITKIELEARAVAARIKKLIRDEMLIVDKKTKKYRKCEYRDIAILFRTVSGWADEFIKILQEEGIPAHTNSRTGYFSTFEVSMVLDFLSIIDNPYQDIPLTAVLTSPIYNMSPEDMAIVKLSKISSMYEACKEYVQVGDNDNVKNKLQIFFRQLDEFRKISEYTEIHKLIWKILDDTDFENIIGVMPNGEQRSANLDLLLEKAMAFEKTSYKGLFNFVKYIESLKKAEIDYGEAEIISESENAVRIMSIHKSKGLEFPIVFVSGMGKLFNEMDARASVVIHSDLGIGTDYVDYEKRTKRTTLIKKVLQNQISLENKGEELRILYVAMTRAKEKLIMTGSMSKIPDKLVLMSDLCEESQQMLMYKTRKEARNYISWVTNALARNKAMEPVYMEYELHSNVLNPYYESISKFEISMYGVGNLMEDEFKKQIEENQTQKELREYLNSDREDEEISRQIQNQLNWDYRYKEEMSLHAKVSVSEIKIAALSEADKEAEELFKANEREKKIPKFVQEQEAMTGTARGNAYHKVMELINFKDLKNADNLYKAIEEQMRVLAENKKISEDTKNAVRIKALVKFFESGLGKRMIEADSKEKLFKEKQFVMGMPAKEIYPENSSEEIVLMQGIIDGFFEEDGKYILMDYKTDYVQEEMELVKRYKKQLELYKKAISQIYNAKVDEMILYSFSLNKEVNIEE